jgi:hypothetical protein
VTVAMRLRPPYRLGVGRGVRVHDPEPMDSEAANFALARLGTAKPSLQFQPPLIFRLLTPLAARSVPWRPISAPASPNDEPFGR